MWGRVACRLPCSHAYMCVFVCLSVYVNTRVCGVRVCVQCTHLCLFVWECVYVSVRVCVCAFVCVFVFVYVYICPVCGSVRAHWHNARGEHKNTCVRSLSLPPSLSPTLSLPALSLS